MPTSLPFAAGACELALAAIGAVALWRVALSPAARARTVASPLMPWNARVTDFLAFLLFVISGSMIAAMAAMSLGKLLPLRGDAVTVFNGAAAQIGMLAGVIIYRLNNPEHSPAPPPPTSKSVGRNGTVTFLIALPVLIATANLWEQFLKICGLPLGKQDLIGMFVHADSGWLLAIMIVLAVVLAPITEELVFRAGLFRYFRTRMPRWVALTAPALFFATLHVNWTTLQGLSSLAPLTVLAVIFSIAYERTGRIETPIIAHALFNLNTVILIFAGVGL